MSNLTTSGMFPNGADIFSATASADIVEYRIVKQTTTQEENYKVAPAGAGEAPFDIAIQQATTGSPVGVCTSGIGAVEVDGSSVAIAAGDKIKPSAGGIGVKAATAGNVYICEALEPATTAGAVIRVLMRYGVVPA